MKFVLIVALIASLGAEVRSDPVCPALYGPVCASNGKTYDNECLLNVAADAEDSTITLKFHGTCEYSDWDETVCGVEKNKKICGSDGINYNNQCYFDFAVKRNPLLMKRNGGPCVSFESTEVICGSDREFYFSVSGFLAEQSVRPQLGVWRFDDCKPEPPAGPKVTSERPRPPPIGKPLPESEILTVCGSDLLIYFESTFKKQQKIRPDLKELPLNKCYYKPFFQE